MASLAPPSRQPVARKASPTASGTRKREPGVAGIQPKLKVSSPGDAGERAADQAADRVMRAAKPFPMAGPRTDEAARKSKDERPKRKAKEDKAARKTKEEKPQRTARDEKAKRKTKDDKPQRKTKDETAKRKVEPATSSLEDKVQRDAAPSAGLAADGSVPAGFESSLGHARQAGGGRLSGDTLAMMESGFDRGLGGVRVYNDGAAASLARSIDARAFALGTDMFFGAGEYQPHSSDGRRLIAHELAHVVQQEGGSASRSSVSRTPTTDSTGTPTTTGTPPDAAAASTPPVDPKTFTGSAGKRIVKEPADQKLGTFFLPALKVPTMAGGLKGASNHSIAALQGRPAEGKNPLTSGAGYVYLGKTPRGSTSARQTWIAAARGNAAVQEGLKGALQTRFGAGTAPGPDSGTATPSPASAEGGEPAPLAAGGQPQLYLKPSRNEGAPFYIVGTHEQIAQHEFVVMPIWNKGLRRHEPGFHIDHMHELQLGGLDGWDNFCVLDAPSNSSSGGQIHRGFKGDVDGLIREAQGDHYWTAERGGAPAPAFEQIVAGWRVQFERLEALPLSMDSNSLWTREEIRAGEHLGGLRAMTDRQIAEAGLRFIPGSSPRFLNVFSNANGGFFKRLNRSGEGWRPAGSGAFYRGFDQVAATIRPFDNVQNGQRVGELTGRVFFEASKSGKVFDAPGVELPLLQSTSLGFGLYVDRGPLNRQLQALYMKQASPVSIHDAGVDALGVVFVDGHIEASIPLFSGTEIPFSIYGNELTISFPIPTDRLRLGPVEVTEAALEIGVNSEGLALGGIVAFVLTGVGRGRLEARAATGGEAGPPTAAAGGGPAAGAAPAGAESGFSLVGTFNFDTDKLDPAQITVGYRQHQFTVDALVGVREGSVRGLQSAEIHIRSGPEGILFEGTAVLGIPSLSGTTLNVSRNPAGDIAIGADNIPLPITSIPGVRSATANIHVVRESESGEWNVSGGGAAEIAIGGVTGTLRVDVAGPFVTIAGENIQIHRGPLEGSGNFLVSNRPRDEAGNPLPEGEPGEMIASGHLEASLPLGPYLRGTIGGSILPNGELEFTGGLALPPTVDLFDARRYEREIFRPPSLDIPIFGISAAGQRIGIFATIGGSLSFTAGFGPGQLRDTALTATFNPDHPEATTVHGTANFVVPAQAGLRLEVHGGIGAGIPIVSAEAGIEIGGQLGIAAEASAAVTVDWTPAEGLAVQAVAHLSAQPQFTFDISAYVRIVADVVITEFELYSERWTLASFTFGPSLTFGIDLPIRWSEQAGLDFDVNRIAIRTPDVDFQQIGSDIIDHLVG